MIILLELLKTLKHCVTICIWAESQKGIMTKNNMVFQCFSKNKTYGVLEYYKFPNQDKQKTIHNLIEVKLLMNRYEREIVKTESLWHIT